MTDLAWTNYVVCASNVFGLLAVRAARDPIQMALAGASIGASALMHISERKHGLPGVGPFAAHSTLFLWVDRLAAYAAALYVLHGVVSRGMPIPWETLSVGGLALLLSERFERGPVWFAVTHSVWHLCAYRILALSFAP